MQPGAVRPIEYEIVLKAQAGALGVAHHLVNSALRSATQLGVLRCVDHQGQKVTLVGDAKNVRKLLSSGQASDPQGIQPKKANFPVIVQGWRATA